MSYFDTTNLGDPDYDLLNENGYCSVCGDMIVPHYATLHHAACLETRRGVGVYPGGLTVSSGGTSLGPISSPGVRLVWSTPNTAPPPPPPPSPPPPPPPVETIKPGCFVTIVGHEAQTAFLVLAEWAKTEGDKFKSMWPLLVLAGAEGRLPDYADLGDIAETAGPPRSRIVSKAVCLLVTEDRRAAIAASEAKKKQNEANDAKAKADAVNAQQIIERNRAVILDATQKADLARAQARAQAAARSKHRARMRLLRRYGPTVGRLACGIAGTLLAILGLVLAGR